MTPEEALRRVQMSVQTNCGEAHCTTCGTNRAALETLRAALVDAARWRALRGCARMHYMGSAGFSMMNAPGADPSSRKLSDLIPFAPFGVNYLHCGLEFWSQYRIEGKDIPVEASRFERDMLLVFVDHIIARGSQP